MVDTLRSNSHQMPNREFIDSLLRNKSIRDSIFNRFSVLDGRAIKHVVRKGETWESISYDYIIAEDELKKANPYESVCYVGLELDIPTFSNDEEIAVRNYINKNALGMKAAEYKKKGDYKKEANTYSQIINSQAAPLYVYMLRGEAQMRRGRYEDAQSDFRYVKRNDAHGDYPNVQARLDKAIQLQAQKEAEQAAMIGELFNFASQAANSYFQAKQNMKQSSRMTRGTSVSSGSDNSGDNIGYEPESETVSVKSSGKICHVCKGDGKCIGCHGSGYRTDNYFGHGTDPTHTCGVCSGKGICSICKGTGKV